MPSFLGGGAGEVPGFADGGGPQGIVGRLPERPWLRKDSFGGETPMFLSFEAVVVDPDVTELVSFDPSSWTLSIEDADIRCAVSKGDFPRTSSLCGSVSSSWELCVELWGSSNVGLSFGARGVETVEEGRSMVIERIDLDDWRDCGRELESWASSKVSCQAVSHWSVCYSLIRQLVTYPFPI